ncbi:hypothetical protein [Cupriavidus sp. USMAA2-4]|uniref:hypothetical protein n=1 Tax=Cupriavidus sp. USMAA2-4 TaxID=876364 RepID=UPI0012F4F874|nr:hypothetical protein [Cupriavidus sp. USMAA2-4]
MSPEEREVAQQRFATEVRKNHIAAFERDKANALAIGSKQYIWRSCGMGMFAPSAKRTMARDSPGIRRRLTATLDMRMRQ